MDRKRKKRASDSISRWRQFKRRLKQKLYNHRWVIPLGMIIAVFLVIAVVKFFNWYQLQQAYHLTAEGSVNLASGYRNIKWSDDTYHYNNRITAILIAGLDSDGDIETYAQYTNAPRADSIYLAVIDEQHKRLSILTLDRDTMTDIRRYTLNGRDRGLFTDHLGYAYTYGDGGAVSCTNLCEAVSNLLYGVPVNGYVVVNRESLAEIAETIGPVSVVVPNNSLADSGIKQGDVVVVNRDNIETFLRSRNTEEEFSNVPRIERQQAYINAAMGKIQSMLEKHPEELWNVFTGMESAVITNIKRNRYLDITKAVSKVSYDSSDNITLSGEHVSTDTYDEFYPDEQALLSTVIDLFYIEDYKNL